MPIRINIKKAKEIQKDRWRETRKPLLENLDIEFMKAVEAGDTDEQQLIAAKKQELRDVTGFDLSEIDDANELKDVWPECLKV